MRTLFRSTLFVLLSGIAATPPTRAAIVSMNLDTMLAAVDGAVHGKVVDRQVFRVDHSQHGRMYFTTMRVAGSSLIDGRSLTVPITYLGGFRSPSDGTRISEMPADHVTQVGREVVAFYKWCDDIGYGVAANVLYAADGGVYPVARRGSKAVVTGRGPGYAVAGNQALDTLRGRTRAIATDLARQGKRFQ